MRTTEADRGQRIVSGQVNGSGVVATGTGFTVAKTAVGAYQIRLVPPMRALVSATASTFAGATAMNTVGGGLPNAPDFFSVYTYNGAGTLADLPFNFTAVGVPR